MKTTYFWKATHEPEPGERYVSVSRQNIKGAENMETYPALMPDWKLIKMAHDMGYSEACFEIYRKEYFEQLKKLNAEKVYEDLKDCILVCFESPKDIVSGKKFCHRCMIAGWIEDKLGIIVPEEVREKAKNHKYKIFAFAKIFLLKNPQKKSPFVKNQHIAIGNGN